MKETEDCFLKVKNDYLKFLSREKIFNKSKFDKIKILKYQTIFVIVIYGENNSLSWSHTPMLSWPQANCLSI